VGAIENPHAQTFVKRAVDLVNKILLTQLTIDMETLFWVWFEPYDQNEQLFYQNVSSQSLYSSMWE
jgi:hypothetical protein